MTTAATAEDKVLRLMAEKYPTKEIVYEKIVYLQSQLMLPKGTEHFMSDLHGAYDVAAAIGRKEVLIVREDDGICRRELSVGCKHGHHIHLPIRECRIFQPDVEINRPREGKPVCST